MTVRDHGPGFDEADLPHVFDRFYRSTAARSLQGSGLGLAIVRQVADAPRRRRRGGRDAPAAARSAAATRPAARAVPEAPDETSKPSLSACALLWSGRSTDDKESDDEMRWTRRTITIVGVAARGASPCSSAAVLRSPAVRRSSDDELTRSRRASARRTPSRRTWQRSSARPRRSSRRRSPTAATNRIDAAEKSRDRSRRPTPTCCARRSPRVTGWRCGSPRGPTSRRSSA